MYKIKYGRNRLTVLLSTLLFVFFFAAGAVTVLVAEVAERVSVARAAEKSRSDDLYEEVSVAEEIPIPVPETVRLREVQIEGIELANYISEGDLIDIRIVKQDGTDEKLLAEKRITGIDRAGFMLLVEEEELGIITGARLETEEGGIIRAYAVRIP